MIPRCKSFRTILLALFAVVPLFAALPAQAHHVSITIDGNLADLEAAVAANLGSDKGGFATDDAKGDRYAGVCAFPNGFDMRRFIALFDFKEPNGSFSSQTDLYLGFLEDSTIGDTDGDGNPDITSPTSPGISLHCTTGEQTGIGGGEFYTIQFDTDCDGLFDDFSLGVTNNQVAVIDPNTGNVTQVIADGVFCYKSGNCATGTPLETLEIKIPNIGRFFPAGTDPCAFQFIGFSGARNDGPGEDTSDQTFTLSIPPDIEVTKTPATQDACPGTIVSWAILVSNPGLCNLDNVTVIDTLDAGLTFNAAGTTPAPASVNGQIITWTFHNIGPGQSQPITLAATVDAPCVAAVLNNRVTAEGTHLGACLPPEGASDSDRASAVVNCTQPDVSIDKNLSDRDLQPGDLTTVTLTVSNPGNTDLNPVTVCDKISAGTSFNEAQAIGGSCGATVASVTTNPDGSKTICFSNFSLAKGASCTITYQVGCASPGTHPDTSTVTAFCAGTNQNPVIAKDNDQFVCRCPADVEIEKRLSPTTVNQGELVSVTLVISNPGTTVLDPIDVCDKLDAGVGFNDAQVIGGSCGVSLKSNTLNPDGSRTICFTPFSLNPGANCTITYNVSCVTTGEHPDTATVVAKCKGGAETDVDRDQFEANFLCQGEGSCPRTVGYWAAQCAQKLNGSTKFDKAHVTSIASCVDDKVDIFNWGDDFTGFCTTITPEKPINCQKQALRQFAGLLANVCVGELRFLASNGDSIFVRLDAPNPCPGAFPGAATIGNLIDAIDDLLVLLQSQNADPQDQRYCQINECVTSINEGRSIQLTPDCAEGTSIPSRGTGSELSTMGDAGVVGGVLELYRPVPNPFNATTTIAYAVNGSNQQVQIGIYNVAGRLVRSLVNESKSPGQYQAVWDGRGSDGAQVAHGVYFLRAFVGGQRVAAGSRILYLR